MHSPRTALDVRNLRVSFRLSGGQSVEVVRDISFSVPDAGCVALAGESGCGKSMTCMALSGLPPTHLAHCGGSVCFEGADLRQLHGAGLRAARRRGLAYIFQDPAASLDPVMRVSAHLAECRLLSGKKNRLASSDQELLQSVGLPERCLNAYPGQLSGGQQQRVMIAMALASKPRVLIADEPTTALDVRTQRQVLDLLATGCRDFGIGWLLVTHNLALAATYADRLLVMYAGRLVESGAVDGVLRSPRHPYTQGLLRAVPRLRGARRIPAAIPGTVPEPVDLARLNGCAFAPRCERADARCHRQPPPGLNSAEPHQVECWHPDPAV